MQKTLRNGADKAHAKSFSSQQRAPKKVVEPLTRTFFSHLIKLETDFYNKQYTAETLDELTQLYAKAVEYYDTIKDEIASYFIFKIQDALASKKSLKILMDQSAKDALRKSSLISSSDPILESTTAALSPKGEEIDIANEVIEEDADEHNSEDEDDVNVKEFEKKRKAYYEKRNRTQRVSFSTMKNQKQKFVHFFHKMETQKAQQKQNMHTLIDDYSKSAKGNDQTVKDDLSSQKDRFKAKLEQRKQKSIMTHTLNTSTQFMALRTSLQNIGGSIMRKDPNESNRLEDVLKGLDDDDAQFEAAGLGAAGQPDQSDDDGNAKNSNGSEKTPHKKHGIFNKSEQIEFLLPMKINNFDDGSNPDSLAFISPRDVREIDPTKLSKSLSDDSSRAVETVSGGDNVQVKGQAAEQENISS